METNSTPHKTINQIVEESREHYDRFMQGIDLGGTPVMNLINKGHTQEFIEKYITLAYQAGVSSTEDTLREKIIGMIDRELKLISIGTRYKDILQALKSKILE